MQAYKAAHPEVLNSKNYAAAEKPVTVKPAEKPAEAKSQEKVAIVEPVEKPAVIKTPEKKEDDIAPLKEKAADLKRQIASLKVRAENSDVSDEVQEPNVSLDNNQGKIYAAKAI